MVLARTVANGCDRERNVERTHPQPPDPQSETGTLATHSGKNELIFLGKFDLNGTNYGLYMENIWFIYGLPSGNLT